MTTKSLLLFLAVALGVTCVRAAQTQPVAWETLTNATYDSQDDKVTKDAATADWEDNRAVSHNKVYSTGSGSNYGEVTFRIPDNHRVAVGFAPYGTTEPGLDAFTFGVSSLGNDLYVLENGSLSALITDAPISDQDDVFIGVDADNFYIGVNGVTLYTEDYSILGVHQFRFQAFDDQEGIENVVCDFADPSLRIQTPSDDAGIGLQYAGSYLEGSVTPGTDIYGMPVPNESGSVTQLTYSGLSEPGAELRLYVLLNAENTVNSVIGEYQTTAGVSTVSLQDLSAYSTITGGISISQTASQLVSTVQLATSQQTALNWHERIYFDPSGTEQSRQRTYLDLLGRRVQVKQRNREYDAFVTQQVVYDAYGRMAMATLPAPTGTVQFTQGFIQPANWQQGTAEYTHTAFDGANLNSPQPVRNNLPSTVGHYYSASNTDRYTAESGYPFQRTVYAEDPTGLVESRALAGEELRQGKDRNHAQYHLTAGDELTAVYATNELPLVSITHNLVYDNALTSSDGIAYRKEVSWDAEKNVRVSFISTLNGQTVATCRSGVGGTTSEATIPVLTDGTGVVMVHLPDQSAHGLKLPLPEVREASTGNWVGLTSGQVTYRLYSVTQRKLLTAGVDYQINGNRSVTFLGMVPVGVPEVLRISIAFSAAVQNDLATGTYTASRAEVKHQVDYSQWTLYYYDLAGRLRKTVSPNSVNATGVGQHGAYAAQDFNERGLLIAEKVPDEGITEYLYDSRDRLKYMQDAVQRANDAFAYTYYDTYNRMTESGLYEVPVGGYFFENDRGNTTGSSVGTTSVQTVLDGTLPAANTSEHTEYFYGTLPAGEEIPAGFTRGGQYTQPHTYGRLSKVMNAHSARWYGYAHSGNRVYQVEQFVDDEFVGYNNTVDAAITTVDYEYNYYYGRLTTRFLQYGPQFNTEQYTWEYGYNADNRLDNVYLSNTQEVFVGWAKLRYHLNGALKRVELGDLQGMDFTYTLHGALKAINSPSGDPGQDGTAQGLLKDLFSLEFDYFANDYASSRNDITAAVNGTLSGRYDFWPVALRYRYDLTDADNSGSIPNPDVAHASNATYNINLASVPTDQVMGRYEYDDLGRLSQFTLNTYHNTGAPAQNTFTAYEAYKVNGGGTQGIAYDANGNITALRRNSYQLDNTGNNTDDFVLDLLNYTYGTAGTNQLTAVADNATQTVITTDFNTGSGSGFTYDARGQLTESVPEGVSSITYNRQGQVTGYQTAANTVTIAYGPTGHKVKERVLTGANAVTRWYSYDRLGRTVVFEASYSTFGGGGGTVTPTLNEVTFSAGGKSMGTYDPVGDEMAYILADHQGNVRAAFKKSATAGKLTVLAWADYYPFGGRMPGRGYSPTAVPHQYQGMGDAPGGVAWGSFLLRMYNPALGRFLSVDPFRQFHSAYIGMGNTPHTGTDPSGGRYLGYEPVDFSSVVGIMESLRTAQYEYFSGLAGFNAAAINGELIGTVDGLAMSPRQIRRYIMSGARIDLQVNSGTQQRFANMQWNPVSGSLDEVSQDNTIQADVTGLSNEEAAKVLARTLEAAKAMGLDGISIRGLAGTRSGKNSFGLAGYDHDGETHFGNMRINGEVYEFSREVSATEMYGHAVDFGGSEGYSDVFGTGGYTMHEGAYEQEGASSFDNSPGPTWRTPLGLAMIALGQPWLAKRFVTPGSSGGTSIASYTLRRVPWKSPVRLPTPIVNSSGARIAYTKSIGRFTARWIPFVGWGLLVYDLGKWAHDATTEVIERDYNGDKEAWWRDVSGTTEADPNLYLCFVEGTTIQMADGTQRPIEQIVKGNSVLTFDTHLKRIKEGVVKRTDESIQYNFVKIVFGNGVINENTPSHPYYVLGKGWCSFDPRSTKRKYGLEVKKLSEGDECYYYDAESGLSRVRISSIREINYPDGKRTFNLSEVLTESNFFANGFLVHNKLVPDSGSVASEENKNPKNEDENR